MKLFPLDPVAWASWLAEHEPVRELAERLPPDRLYEVTLDGEDRRPCRIHGYSEDGTVEVILHGIAPEDLKETDGCLLCGKVGEGRQ